MTNSIKNYTLSPKWVIRKERKIYPYFIAYDTYLNKKYELSESAFSLLNIFKYNSLSIDDLFNEIKEMYTKEELNSFLLHNSVLANLLIESDTAYQNEFKEEKDLFTDSYSIAIAKYPMEAEIHLTERCNLQCKHCGYGCTNDSPLKDISYLHWEKVFDDFEKNGLFKLVISGGEPFFYPEITEILRNITNRKFRVEILTNATLIKNEHLEFLSSPNIFLNISLDGSQKKYHEYLRGKNTFDRTINILYKLKEINAQVTISSTIHKKNILQLESLIEESIKMKSKTINFILLDNIGRAKNQEELNLSFTDRRFITEKVKELTKKYSKMINIGFMDPTNPEYDYLKKEKLEANSKIYCTAATVRIAIAANGDVYPCVYGYGYEEIIGGNIKTQKILDIWETPNWKMFRGEILLNQLSECKNCSLLNSCSLKVCRLRAKVYSNNLYGIPHNCPKTNYIE